jgi:hypothetical protein
MTEYGKPFTASRFGNKKRGWCLDWEWCPETESNRRPHHYE